MEWGLITTRMVLESIDNNNSDPSNGSNYPGHGLDNLLLSCFLHPSTSSFYKPPLAIVNHNEIRVVDLLFVTIDCTSHS